MSFVRPDELERLGIRGVEDPTSIPEFLHHDVAYWWALREKRETLGDTWRGRVLSWERLLAWWLLDELQEEEVHIEDELREFLPCPSLSPVRWLHHRSGLRYLGVRSTVVLVRPLPDTATAAILGVEPDPRRDGRLPRLAMALARVLAEAAERESTAGMSALLSELGKIVLDHLPASDQGPHFEGRETSLDLVHPYLGRATVVRGVQRKGGMQRARARVEKCEACARPLLGNGTVSVGSETASVLCASCGAPTSISLRDLGCTWYDRDGVQAFGVWTLGREKGSLPPKPVIEGRRVRFGYDALDDPQLVTAAGERVLDLEVKGCDPHLLDESVFFERALWLGRTVGPACWSPLRLRYLGLLESPDACRTELSPSGATVTCELAVKGLPYPLTRSVPVIVKPAGVGMYPDWRTGGHRRWSRLLAGPQCEISDVRSEGRAKRLLPGLWESREGVFRACEVSMDPVGCTLSWQQPEARVAPDALGPEQSVQVGIDFGTTNSLVYLPFGWSHSNTQASAPLELSKLRESGFVRWLVEPADDAHKHRVLDEVFPEKGKPPRDPTLVPSELCREHQLIPWAARRCCEGSSKIDMQFKGVSGKDETRRQYLEQLLLHGVAAFAKSEWWSPGLRLDPVFTYPLTFTQQDLLSYQAVTNEVCESVSSLLGVPVGPPRWLDESMAGVLAVEHPHSDDIVVTADLGGGTLDLSLGRGARSEKDQIGALAYGGRWLVARVAEKNGQYELEKAIREGLPTAYAVFAKQENQNKLSAYMASLAYFLETMMLSYLERENGVGLADDGRLHFRLYLLGNGWGFHELTAKRGDTEAAAPRELRLLAQRLNDAVESWLKAKGCRNASGEWVTLQAVQRPKHTVALGAQRGSVLQPHPPRIALPAGVTLMAGRKSARGTASLLGWQSLVGPSATQKVELDDNLSCDWVDLWSRLQRSSHGGRLIQLLGIDQKNLEVLDGQVRGWLVHGENRTGGTEAKGYRKGPLQVLLENEWRGKL